MKGRIRSRRDRRLGAFTTRALAIGTLIIGALVIGALAIGAQVIDPTTLLQSAHTPLATDSASAAPSRQSTSSATPYPAPAFDNPPTNTSPGSPTAAHASPHPAIPPAGMVWVPAGTYRMGDTVYQEERPREATTAGFWMDRTEVTNAQFAAFVKATGYRTVAERTAAERGLNARQLAGLPHPLQQPGALVFAPPSDPRQATDPLTWWHYTPGAFWRQPGGPGTTIAGRDQWPVVSVTLEDAQAYARWSGRELPTEAEWEWAARSARDSFAEPDEGNAPTRANTWQGRFPARDTAQDGYAGLAPVGRYPANALGLHDMIGNAWELVSDNFSPGFVVIKGGSFLCSADYCRRARPGSRQPQELDLATSHIGFRTILRNPETSDHDRTRDRQGRPAPQVPGGAQQAAAARGQ